MDVLVNRLIGIDVSKKHRHLSWLRDPERGLVRPKAVDNTPAGHAQRRAWATRHAGVPTTERCFVLEATGVYHAAVARYLHQAGARVTVANPPAHPALR